MNDARRALLTALGIGTTLGLLPASSAWAYQMPANANTSSNLAEKTVIQAETQQAYAPTYDVVVVGAGGAGLAAAASAAAAGLSVIVLEKMPNVGGNTLRAGGYFNAVAASKTGARADSEALFLAQTLKSGGGRNDEQVVRALVANATPTLNWLTSLGMRFNPEPMEVWGSEWPRSHRPTEPRGQGYIRVLTTALLRAGGIIETEARATKLLQNPSGRVIGVRYISTRKARPNRRPDPATNDNVATDAITAPTESETVYARKAVVLAAGGFAASGAMMRRWAAPWAELATDNNPGNTGDMLLAAEEIGAKLINLELVQVVPGAPGATAVRLDTDISRSILLNSLGERFVEEDAPRNVLAAAIVRESKRGPIFSVTVQSTVDRLDVVSQRDIYRGLETGAAWRAESVAELARLLHVRESTLVQTLTSYAQEVSLRQGKCAHLSCVPLDAAPYWAAPITMTVHSTLGGVAINAHGQVLNTHDTPIAGLYAAGEVTGSVHGVNRLGGNGIADAITFGRIVAADILAQLGATSH